MCGGGKKAAPAPVAPAPTPMTYKVMADNSNQQRQVAAISPEAGKPAASTYGSELSNTGAA